MTKHHPKPTFLALSIFVFSVTGGATLAHAETTGSYIDDATITAKVKEAILADSQLSVLQIQAETNHGTVTLSGSVDTKAQEQAALQDAKLVDGAARVKDRLTVKATQAE